MDRAERKQWRARLDRLENAFNEDDDAFMATLSSVLGDVGDDVLRDVGTVAGRMREEIQRFRHSPRVTLPGSDEIPEVRRRIEYLARMTEQAAHETLALVESCMRDIDGLRDALGGENRINPQFRRQAEHLTDGVRANLQNLLLAQGYQDLSGQILGQLDSFMMNLEQGLSEIGQLTGNVLPAGAPESAPIPADVACGPHVPGIEDESYVDSQDDVDRLIDGLGR